jgi:hypothetical protein
VPLGRNGNLRFDALPFASVVQVSGTRRIGDAFHCHKWIVTCDDIYRQSGVDCARARSHEIIFLRTPLIPFCALAHANLFDRNVSFIRRFKGEVICADLNASITGPDFATPVIVRKTKPRSFGCISNFKISRYLNQLLLQSANQS